MTWFDLLAINILTSEIVSVNVFFSVLISLSPIVLNLHVSFFALTNLFSLCQAL